MCSPFDPLVGFGVAIIVALSAAALLRRGRMACVDQRGFAVGEVVKYGGILFFAIALVYVAITHCYPMPLAAGPAAMPLPAGAILKGPPPPSGTRPPACEEGVVCRSPGKTCGRGATCGEIYSWNTGVTPPRWQCNCECRQPPS